MRPNIFDFATKELSQDGFFAWFIQWADKDCQTENPELHQAAQDFVKELLLNNTMEAVGTVRVTRQENNIDLLVKVDKKHIIVIEDKTNTREHSDQLNRYKDYITTNYKDYAPHFIYLKTGNESLSNLNNIEKKKGYRVMDRKAIIELLNRHAVKSDIFTDFKEHLNAWEKETGRCTTLHAITHNWYAAEGFFMKVERAVGEWSDWRYVANPSGGFLGWWYHWVGSSVGELYIQIENKVNGDMKLTIKIDDWDKQVDTLRDTLNKLSKIAKNHGVELEKPARFKVGEYSTVAIVKNAFKANADETFDFDAFVQTLKTTEKIIDDFSRQNK